MIRVFLFVLNDDLVENYDLITVMAKPTRPWQLAVQCAAPVSARSWRMRKETFFRAQML